MKKKIIVMFVALMFVVMLVTPVLAIGPKKAKNNKNLIMQSETSVWMFNSGEIFQEWFSNKTLGIKYRLMRQNASKVNIGNAVDASGWTFPANQSGACFVMLLNAETRWVYLNQTGMYNLLVGFGFPTGMATIMSGQHSDGIYYKADMVGYH